MNSPSLLYKVSPKMGLPMPAKCFRSWCRRPVKGTNSNKFKNSYLTEGMAAIFLYSVLEGLPIEAHGNLIYGIIIHKLPVAIILTTFFLASKLSRTKILFFLTLFALMTPLGVLLSQKTDIFKIYYSEISALVIGIFLHISTVILFESSEGHKFNLTKLIAIVTAIAIAYFL